MHTEIVGSAWLVSGVAVFGFVAIFLYKQTGSLHPLHLFLLLEAVAVWPALLPGSPHLPNYLSGYPIATAMAAAGVTSVTVLGLAARATGWRAARVPDFEWLTSLRAGSTSLVVILILIGLYQFQGAPPLLTSGLGPLLDPSSSSEGTALIRETRRSITKGHTLLGQQYTGQGLVNTMTSIGWRVAVIVALLYWSWVRSRRALIRLAIVLVLAFIFLGSAGARLPILLVILGSGILWLGLNRLSTRRAVAFAGVLFGILLIILPLSKGDSVGSSVTERAQAAATRVVDGNGRNNALIVTLTESGSLEFGRGDVFLEKLVAIIPGAANEVPFALRLTQEAYGTGAGRTGYSTPTQFGLLYADGAWVAALVGYFATGLFISVVWLIALRVSWATRPALLAEMAVLLGYTSIVGIPGALASVPVSIALLVLASGPRVWMQPAVRTPARHVVDSQAGAT